MCRLTLLAVVGKAAISALPVEENPDYPDHDLLRMLLKTGASSHPKQEIPRASPPHSLALPASHLPPCPTTLTNMWWLLWHHCAAGLHDSFRDGFIEPATMQVLWELHEMNRGKAPLRPITYRTPETLIDWISRGKHPGVLLWPLRRRLVETVVTLGGAAAGSDDVSAFTFRDNLLGDRVICAIRPAAHGGGAALDGRAALLDELQMSWFGDKQDAASFAAIKQALSSAEAASSLSDTEFLHIAAMISCVAAGCGSRWHYYSPLKLEDTMFFVECIMVALVLRADRTDSPDDELSTLALKVAKRLSPCDLAMTIALSTMSMCLHTLDGILQNRYLLAAASPTGAADPAALAKAAQAARAAKLAGGGAAGGPLNLKWLDSCDGRLVHAILQISLEARSSDPAFSPYSLAASEAQKAKVALLQKIPWEACYMRNWQGDVVAHVPEAEKSGLAQMNDLQLDMWDREIVDGDDLALVRRLRRPSFLCCAAAAAAAVQR